MANFDDIHAELRRVLFHPTAIPNQGNFQGFPKENERKKLFLNRDNPDVLYEVQPLVGRGRNERESGEREVAHGRYIFAITFEKPDVIYCGLEHILRGHTVLTGGKNVCYAGEIVILNGRITGWSNGSGHYTPDSRLRLVNLHPSLREILPSRFFSEYA